MAGLDASSEAPEVGGQGCRDRSGSAACDRPVLDVGGQREERGQPRRHRLGERQHRVSRTAREQRPRPRPLEQDPREAIRREGRAQSEARHLDRVSRNPQRCERVAEQAVRIPEERLDQPTVVPSVGAEGARGLVEGAIDHDRFAVVERMGDGGRGHHPLEAMLLERQRSEEGRKDPHRMHGGADVVREAGQRQLAAAHSAADLVGSFEHEHAGPAAGELDRGRQPVGARADHDRVGIRIGHTFDSSSWPANACRCGRAAGLRRTRRSGRASRIAD